MSQPCITVRPASRSSQVRSSISARFNRRWTGDTDTPDSETPKKAWIRYGVEWVERWYRTSTIQQNSRVRTAICFSRRGDG